MKVFSEKTNREPKKHACTKTPRLSKHYSYIRLLSLSNKYTYKHTFSNPSINSFNLHTKPSIKPSTVTVAMEDTGSSMASNVARAIVAALDWSSSPDARKSAVSYLESVYYLSPPLSLYIYINHCNLFPMYSQFKTCNTDCEYTRITFRNTGYTIALSICKIFGVR